MINFSQIITINLFNNFRQTKMSKLVSSKSNPPLGAMMTANALSSKTPVSLSWGQETCFTSDGAVVAANSSGISRYV